jgi:hypothetical protein
VEIQGKEGWKREDEPPSQPMPEFWHVLSWIHSHATIVSEFHGPQLTPF